MAPTFAVACGKCHYLRITAMQAMSELARSIRKKHPTANVTFTFTSEPDDGTVVDLGFWHAPVISL